MLYTSAVKISKLFKKFNFLEIFRTKLTVLYQKIWKFWWGKSPPARLFGGFATKYAATPSC